MAGQDGGERKGMMKAGWELAFGVARGDFSARELPELDWGPGQASESLSRVYKHASDQCHDAITWYLHSMHGKRRGAVAFRLGAIMAGSAAGILPILTMIFTTDGRPAFSPAWASVAIGIAAALLLFDRFFGSSTGWMRFIRTEMHLRQLHQEFEMNWERERAAWAGQDPSAEQVQEMLGRAMAFVTRVSEVVRQETEEWVLEFQSTLRQIDEASRARTETQGEGQNPP